MKISFKLTLAFVVMTLLVGAVSGYSIYTSKHIKEDVRVLEGCNFNDLMAITQMAYDVQRVKSNMRQLLLEAKINRNPREIEYVKKQIRESLSDITTNIEMWKRGNAECFLGFHNDKIDLEHQQIELKKQQVMKEKLNHFVYDITTALNVYSAKGPDQAFLQYNAQSLGESRELEGELNALYRDGVKEATARVDEIAKCAADGAKVDLIVFVVSVLLAVILTAFIYVSITKPIIKISQMASEIGKGDLSLRIPAKSNDELGQLASTLDKMAEELSGAIEKEKSLATAETKRAAELDALNQQLRASEQQLRASNQQLAAKEQALLASQEALKSKLSELERFNKLMVGREMQMIELKKDINSLLARLNEPPKFNT